MHKTQEKIKPEENGRPGDPCIMVIFGASGDLTTRKLIPALYNLRRTHLLPDDFALLGVAVDQMTEDAFRDKVRKDVREYAGAPEECKHCDWLVDRIHYLSGDFRDPDTYQRIKSSLTELDQEHGNHGNFLYYLATAPSFFAEVPTRLGEAGSPKKRMVIGGAWSSKSRSATIWNRRAA